MSGRRLVERVKRGLAIVVGFDVEALGLKRHGDGRQNIPVVVKCNISVSLYCPSILFFRALL
jgi:hypothetical protein